jgi:nanoRNase/pAp phosphatase (c-di-AMP/oligoRNAs hydrolase)
MSLNHITITRKKKRTAGAKVLRLASHQGLGGHWLQGGMSKKNAYHTS